MASKDDKDMMEKGYVVVGGTKRRRPRTLGQLQPHLQQGPEKALEAIGFEDYTPGREKKRR